MKTFYNLNKKCGEITFCTQVGKRVYALNCLHCPQICLHWDVYITHMEQEHEENLNFDHILQPENDDTDFQMDNEEEYDDSKQNSPISNKLDYPDQSTPDDPLESENSTTEKYLESSIKIEKLECSPNPLSMFEGANNSHEKNNSELTVNVNPNLVYHSSTTNLQEGPNSSFVTVGDLKNFRNEFREELHKSEMRLRNQIKEQPASINKVIMQLMEAVKLDKSNDIIKTTPKTNVIPAEPFSSIEDFLKYDSEIQNNEDKYLQLVYDFEHQNAKCLQHYVKLNWKKIVNDGAAQHMCWKGTEKKKPVRSLAVTQALKAACIKKYKLEADFNFEKICILHFQHAKGRHEKKLNYKSRTKPAI